MQFIITAHDGADMLDKRLEVREAHLQNLLETTDKLNGKIVCAGGILSDEGKMMGSVLVMDFPGREELDAYLESEPYIKAGVWAKVDVERMNVVFLNGEKVGK